MLQIKYFLLLSFYFMHTSGLDRAVHVVYSIVQIAVDRLSLDTESSVIKIYKYFNIYTIGIAQLNGFCDFVDTELSAVSQHG